jgi:tryptophan 2,3-dioxygenase
MSENYASYLKLDELLRLQRPLSDGPEHDEMLFIVIHQVHELWFKQMLHELKLLQLALENGHSPTVMRTLKRLVTVVKTLLAQVDVLETMTPVSFSSFRERLHTAGGRRSRQFRELEIVLGRRDEALFDGFPEEGPDRSRLEGAVARRPLYDSFLRYLVHIGYTVPSEVLERDVTQPYQPHSKVQDALEDIYTTDPTAWQVCELLVDLDEALQAWRYRHLKMVERTVGGGVERGGGAEAFDHLRQRLLEQVFPDLWQVRRRL